MDHHNKHVFIRFEVTGQLNIIASYNPEYLVLTKYIPVLTPAFTSQFHNKIINIHRSFLPAFVGAKPYEQAFERGVKLIGATTHFVIDNLDEGANHCSGCDSYQP